jgi:ubiquinone/menaquinone biosynthesis C-methylase UbiE
MAVSHVATPEDVKVRVSTAYNQAADYYDHAANAFWERFGRRTVERLSVPAGARVLDLCCGTGASALPAAERVGPSGKVLAVDLAEELIRLAKKKAQERGLRNLEFLHDDMMALDLEPASFDFVLCVFGIFFVPDMAAALQQMWRFVAPSGQVAVTTWGQGLFEPANATFWEAINRVRPDLYKSFNPWDQVGDPQLLTKLFADAGLPRPVAVLEPGMHPIRNEADLQALMLGTGYRGVVAQLSDAHRRRVQQEVVDCIHSVGVTAIRTDVVYATCQKPAA